MAKLVDEREDFCNQLKFLDTRTLEDAFSKVISDLTGIAMHCSISSISYRDVDGANLSISIDRNLSDFLKKMHHDKPTVSEKH